RVALAYVELLTEIKEQPASQGPSANIVHHPAGHVRGESGYPSSRPMESCVYFDLTKADCARPPDTVRNIPEVVEFLQSLRPQATIKGTRHSSVKGPCGLGPPQSQQPMLGASRECDSISHNTTAHGSTAHSSDFDRSRPVHSRVSVEIVSSLGSADRGTAMFRGGEPINTTHMQRPPTEYTPSRSSEPTSSKVASSSYKGVPTGDHRGRMERAPPTTRPNSNPNCPDAWIPGHQCDDLCSTTLCGLEGSGETNRGPDKGATRKMLHA
ncbi:hypothetical protein FOZ63_007857, partial [Perkinsus olseni]